MTVAISARNLTKVFRIAQRDPGVMGALRALIAPSFKTVIAVNAVTFDIQRGEAIGYIGPNGAGKSTTIKMLSGILVPTSGDLEVLGLIPHRRRMELVRHIGVVFGQRTQLWWDLPLRESFYLLQKVYEISDHDFQCNMKFFNEYLGLNELWDRPVRSLSLGQRMRAELAAAFVHRPQLLILDEPTIGLDVLAKESLRAFLRELNTRYGVTILLATHDLRDVEEICNRLVVIDRGQIRYQGTLGDLTAQYGFESFLTVELERQADGLPAIPGLQLVSAIDRRMVFSYNRHHHNASHLISVLTSVLPVKHVTQRDSNLEDIIQRLYRGVETK
ncbi:MAG: ATP-binding cassette domain-containing protein [Candidatus Methanomethyliaceae archaeon]